MDFYLLRIAIGLVIGFIIGMTGVGGGVLVVPALSSILGLPVSTAVGTANLYSFLTKIYAAYQHFRLKTIDYFIGLLFLIGAIPGNIIASRSIIYLANRGDKQEVLNFQRDLKLFIAGVMLMSVFILLINLKTSQKNNFKANHKHFRKKILGIFFGIIVGGLIGSTSVGGGVLIVPLLIIFFGLSSQKTVGSSILIAVVLTFVSSILYSKGSNVDIKTAVIMWVGSLPGVLWGSKMAIKFSEKKLQKIVIGIIFFSIILMFSDNY